MSRARLYRVSAVVVRQRDLGEADRILTLFTRERGKLSAVARGVKRVRSRFAPVLQLFAHARVQLAAGRSLEVVTQAQPVEMFYHLRQELERYAYACYVAELVDTVTEEGAVQEEVFALLLATLRGLDAGGEPVPLVRGYEVKLLTELGYGPEMETCVSCGVEVGERPGGFSVPEGGVLCRRCGKRGGTALSPAALQGLRDLLRAPQEELGRRRLTKKARQELEVLMRRFVDYRLERELRSTPFLPT